MNCGRWVGGGLLAALLAVWLGAGAYVWNRNRVPAPPVQTRTLPAGNVYDQYVGLVQRIREPDQLTALDRSRKTSGNEVARVLQANAEALSALKQLAGHPSAVTELRPGVRFVSALAFPSVTRLTAIAARSQARSKPTEAAQTLNAGLCFAAGVMRDGATLQLTTGYLSFVPLFEAAPDILRRFSAEDCRTLMASIEKLDRQTTPLASIFRTERVSRLEQFSELVKPGAVRIFRLNIPRADYEWQFLLKPKRPAYDALDTYLAKWAEEAAKLPLQVTPPAPPTEMEGILADESLEPRALATHVVRHAYIVARMRILYAALAAELVHERTGRYPATLKGLAEPAMLSDPFSGAPLIYKGMGGSYRLYSVGPNGKDDGGAPYKESRMSADGPGDLPLRPTF